MTTTTTTSKSVTTQLKKLEEARAKAYAKVQEAKAKVQAHEQATQALRAEYTERHRTHADEFERSNHQPRPGTEGAKLQEKVRERRQSPNPHEAEFVESRDEFHRHDTALREFKVAHVHDRLAELDADSEAAEQAIREGFESLKRGCELYGVNVEEVRAVIADTPPLSRGNPPYLGFDPRPREWYSLACDALDTEVAKPGLTDHALARLAEHG